jgi:hypothetical protein
MTTDYLGRGLQGVADIGTATAIAAQFFAPTVNAVSTSGYSTNGSGAGFYTNDSLATASLAAAHPLFCKQSADGRYWRLLPEANGFISVTSGGALGNGVADDYAAIQATIDYGLSFLSATIFFPTGTYIVSASPTITHGKGLNLRGEGPDHTIISAGAFPAMKTVGYWRSIVEGIGFWCNANITGGAFELDGEPDGSFGVQGVTFRNCYFFGNYNSKYAFTNVRVAGGSGQGSECTWIGCFFAATRGNSGDAAFLNNGNNALQNTLIGCNFQSFNTGIMVTAGNVDILHCGFQSTYGYNQILNDGWDVDGSYSSVGDTCTMTGCRSESLRIYRGGGVPVNISGFAHTQGAAGGWGTGAKALNALVTGQTAAGNIKLYRVTTAGTSGGAQPVWPESGTVTDGSVVWTQTNFGVFHNVRGSITNGQIQLGQFGDAPNGVGAGGAFSARIENVAVSRDDCFPYGYFISGPGPQTSNLFIGGAPSPGNTNRPIKIGNNNNAGARNTNPHSVNLSDQSLVWTEGVGGGAYHDISIQRGAGDFNNKGNNYFALTGGWGFDQIAFASLFAVARDGVVFFVTDGTPGSSPLTGGGSGCLAVRQSGSWSAVNLGAGLLSSDGTGTITLGTIPAIPSVTLVNGAGCAVAAKSITCAAAAGWGTAGAYSTESYVGDVDFVARITGTLGSYLIGLNSDPTTDNSYASIDYAIYVVAGSPATVQAWQSGGAIAVGPNIVDGDSIAIRRIGTTIQYLHNRTVFATSTGISATTPLFLDSAFNNSGGVIDNIGFGPLAFQQAKSAIKGLLQFDRVAFTQLVALVVSDGATIYVTDGTPGSNPLTGSGTGCLALRQNGAWRAISMGIVDGDKGDITVTSSGTAWAIDNGVISLAKMADIATASLIYRKTAGAGAPEVQTLATLKTDLGLIGTNSGDQTTVSGNAGSASVLQTPRSFSISGGGVTAAAASFDGSANVILSASVDAGHITLVRMANLAANSFIGNNTASGSPPLALTGTQATALLGTFTSAAKGLAPASGGGATNFLRADGTWAAPAGTGGLGDVVGPASATDNVLARFDTTTGKLIQSSLVTIDDSGNIDTPGSVKLGSIATPTAPSAGIFLYSGSVAGRHMPRIISPAGIDSALQVGLHGNSVFFASPASSTSAPNMIGGTISTVGTVSAQQTIASANPWQAAQRKRFQTAATAASSAGMRTAYVQWFRGSAAGFGGFFFRTQFGQNLNVSGAQSFIGLCASTGALGTTAGAVAALLHMVGMGYDTTDASTGNWQLFRNDGTGTATKVDLGSGAARNTTHGYDLVIFCPPGAATTIYVKVTNAHTGTVVLDTSYTTDLPAVDTGLAYKAECNNGAVAAALNLEVAKVYIESDY